MRDGVTHGIAPARRVLPAGIPVLEARGLTAVRPGDEGPVTVLDGVDFTLARGETAEITGPSGAGKTTFLLALARLLPDVRGTLILGGYPAGEFTAQQWRTRVALLPQRPALTVDTVAENLRLPWHFAARSDRDLPPDESLRAALDTVGLSAVSLERDAARLSVGQASRVALVRVMLTEPDVLLLDEPDASLDDESADAVAQETARFAAEGGCVVRVSHVRADVNASVRYRLAGGRLAVVGGAAAREDFRPRAGASPDA